MSERIAVFIDGGFVEKISQQEFANLRVDYDRLSTVMASGLSHLRTYYYHCLPYQSNPPTEEEKERFANRQRFYNALERIPRFQVRLGRLRRRGNDFEQKGVDVFLAIDLVQLAVKRLITHAAMITADSDFLPAIEVAKNEGVIIRLFHSQHLERQKELWQCADERIIVDAAFMSQIEKIALI
jgi:uncharacterized LabA/DUF88 family protein